MNVKYYINFASIMENQDNFTSRVTLLRQSNLKNRYLDMNTPDSMNLTKVATTRVPPSP